MDLVYSFHYKHSKYKILSRIFNGSPVVWGFETQLCEYLRMWQKLVKTRLTDGLKMVTFYLALNRPEN